MNKISFDDIQPGAESSEGRSIRDVQVPISNDRQRRTERHAERRMPEYANTAELKQNGAKGGSLMLWASALVILAALVVIATFMFIGRTTVDLTIRVAHVATSENAVYSAYRTPENNELGFTVVNTTAELSEVVPATETKFVEQKASGKITVHNDYSSKNQRLIKNTRFETPDGKIYRVRNSLVVPGNGTVEVTVYADKPGEEYNKDSAKFTIPGLKGDERFDKFWAESTTPLSGGFSGDRAVVGDSELASKRESLRMKLREQLTKDLQSVVTDGQALFDGGVFITYESTDTAELDGESVKVTEKAIAQALLFDSTILAEDLAKASSVLLYEGNKALINPNELSFSIIQKEKVDPAKDELIQFTVSGDAKLLWAVDVDALKRDLSGKPSSALDPTLAEYPGVKDAYVTIRPFWRSNFPTDLDEIDIKVETQQ